MTEAAKKYTLTAQNIQAYLCELGIKPTEEVSIYSIEYYFDKLPVSTDELSVEKLQEQLNTAKKALTEIYLDVNETIIDPVFLFHQSQRIAGRALNELGENNEI